MYVIKIIITILNYYYFFDKFYSVTVEDEGYKKLYFSKILAISYLYFSQVIKWKKLSEHINKN